MPIPKLYAPLVPQEEALWTSPGVISRLETADDYLALYFASVEPGDGESTLTRERLWLFSFYESGVVINRVTFEESGGLTPAIFSEKFRFLGVLDADIPHTEQNTLPKLFYPGGLRRLFYHTLQVAGDHAPARHLFISAKTRPSPVNILQESYFDKSTTQIRRAFAAKDFIKHYMENFLLLNMQPNDDWSFLLHKDKTGQDDRFDFYIRNDLDGHLYHGLILRGGRQTLFFLKFRGHVDPNLQSLDDLPIEKVGSEEFYLLEKPNFAPSLDYEFQPDQYLVESGFSEPMAEPTEEPADEPTAEQTDEPMDEPTAEQTVEPMDEPTDEPVAEPTDEPVAEPTDEPVTESTDEPTDEPTVEPTYEPATESTDEPTAEPTDEPAAAPTDEPTVEPTDEPVTEPTDEPTAEPTDEPAAAPTAEPD